MHQGPGGVNVNLDPATVLEARDTLLVIAPEGPLLELEALNQRADPWTLGPQVKAAPAPGR